MKKFLPLLLCFPCLPWSSLAREPINISGVYPHHSMRNDEGECGTGAVVPWQGSLWAITYAPHRPRGRLDCRIGYNPRQPGHRATRDRV